MLTEVFLSILLFFRQMVTHMSGFPREAPCLSQKGPMLCPDNNTVMLERIRNLTLIAQPGDKVSYRSDICCLTFNYAIFNISIYICNRGYKI